MGLGKTVQVIALLSMLLKMGPYGGVPVVRRCLIVTPGSLVQVCIIVSSYPSPLLVFLALIFLPFILFRIGVKSLASGLEAKRYLPTVCLRISLSRYVFSHFYGHGRGAV